MKDYKKKFILSNLIMVGIILIIMNAVIFFYSYNAGKAELKTTMEQKIEPYGMMMNLLRDKPRPRRERGGERHFVFRLISRRKLTRYCIENTSCVSYNEIKAFLRGNENV